MQHMSFKAHCRQVGVDSVKVTFGLFKVLIPALIAVRLLEQAGLVDVVAALLTPAMAQLDLPPLAGLIWATAMLTNIYAGIVVLITYSADWTLAQVTLIGMLMLGAHNLVVELSIARRAGCRVLPQAILRISAAYGIAWILHKLYIDDPLMQQPHTFIWQPEVQGAGWGLWLETQLLSLFWTAVVIVVLVAVLQFLKASGIERLLERALRPILKLIGISQHALSMTLIGMTLGLAYGGGLLIREAEQGRLKPHEVMSAITLLGLCHSLIEDTLLITLTGASITAVLGYRLLWALVIIAIITRLLPLIPARIFERILATSVVKTAITEPGSTKKMGR